MRCIGEINEEESNATMAEPGARRAQSSVRRISYARKGSIG
jgi:hypothetical protein